MTKARKPGPAGKPTVFISSTAVDLTPYREAAKEAAQFEGFFAEMHEYWPGKDTPPYDECMRRVDLCQVLVVLVAHRYGWEPPDQPVTEGEERKSITWLECERAAGSAEVIPFILSDEAHWPPEDKDEHEVLCALKQHGATSSEFARIAADFDRRTRRLAAFKQWLVGNRMRRTFTDVRSLQQAVERALRDWKDRHRSATDSAVVEQPAPTVAAIPPDYLAWLRKTCASIELLGLDVEEAFAPRLGDVYVPAITTPPSEGDGGRPRMQNAREKGTPEDLQPDQPREALLLARLGQESLYVPGPAGSGKSTFCRWATWVAASGDVGRHRIEPPVEYRETLPESFRDRLPVCVVLRDFWTDLSGQGGARGCTRAVLEGILAAWTDRHLPGGLSGDVLRACLDRGKALLIFDGVDEVPVSHGPEGRRSYPRDVLLGGLKDALPAWTRTGNRLLVTSRPYGLSAAEVAQLGLPIAPLQPLPAPLQPLFVARWFAAADPERAASKTAGLLRDILGRPELRELTGNPMLLTALCVRCNQGEKLPEDQYRLYDSVVNGVLYNRYRDEAQERDPVRRRLAAIALGMHTGSAAGEERTRPVAEVTNAEIDGILQDWAASNRATEGALNDAAQKRADLLSRSGLLLPRPDDKVAFYHLSFQEFLAAEHLLQTVRDDGALLDLVRRRATVAAWRPTLVHAFSALAFRHRSPQWAIDRLLALTGELSREQVKENAAPAVFVADCLDLALAKGWHLDTLRRAFQDVCLHAIEDEVAVQDRARLALTLARLGDPRPGVGVRSDGTPDIDWVRIPAGTVVLEDDGGEHGVAAFEIARYPITNAQFQAFVDADDGHRATDRDWWQGLETSELADPGWTESSAPREMVSWFEAVAFCRWLAARLRCPVRLPTELEWQQAATCGDPQRDYPWGAWEEGACNSGECGISRTSVVGIFPRGSWTHGPCDLAGNVWEWCEYAAGDGSRVVRGGAWFYPAWSCRSAFRHRRRPGDRYVALGFRLAKFVTE